MQAIELGARTILRLSGADRERFLNGQVSNDVRKLTGENSIAACVTTIKGKLDAFVRIIAFDDSYLIDSESELRESLFARLDKYIIADDCELEDISDRWSIVHVLGQIESEHVARSSERFGQPGTDLWLPVDVSTPSDLEFISPADTESLRIRNGVPKWGAELTPDTLPAEAGLDATAIDFHKGCYIGQEVISRIKSVGRVNRRLLRLRIITESQAPSSGQALFQGDVEVGKITSVESPDVLGFIKRGHQEPGNQFSTKSSSSAETGEKNLFTTLEIVDSQIL